NVRSTSYQRPTSQPVTTAVASFVTVKARAGDTITSLAKRFGVAPADVANANGFTDVNAKLAAGRAIKIPKR
ncbi:MAG TPA: LysM peptidoglycan-binding domain-containing protein, partial [Pyrinomonadaceae bacterium]|nr:LysM peptidoglycan-binding domain-containing protein [Pyrinomonadaceae bacterium]